MSSASTSERGTQRLLWDCATVGRTLEIRPASARGRLEAELGADLTLLLLATLRESEPSTPHEERLRRFAEGA